MIASIVEPILSIEFRFGVRFGIIYCVCDAISGNTRFERFPIPFRSTPNPVQFVILFSKLPAKRSHAHIGPSNSTTPKIQFRNNLFSNSHSMDDMTCCSNQKSNSLWKRFHSTPEICEYHTLTRSLDCPFASVCLVWLVGQTARPPNRTDEIFNGLFKTNVTYNHVQL